VIKRIAGALIAVLTGATALAAQGTVASGQDAKNLNLVAYAELLRADVRAEKVAILTQFMELSDAEDKAFWPLYRQYDAEMARLGDERVSLIAEYARDYTTLTDAVAGSLASKALDLEARRHAVKAKHYERIKTALSPRTALRFLQIEQQLLLIIDLQISASLPIVQ
jgi:hypothetical protein